MTRSRLIIGALALATLLPSLSVIASSDAHANRRCAGGGCPIVPYYHPQFHSGAATAIRMMNSGRFHIR